MTALPRRWDIFCKVVDNFGDAGVSWRLARQLAAEHGVDVTLWLDQVAPLARIAPGVAPDGARQRACGVTVRAWPDPWPAADPADVVVEAFGCGLPEAYVAAMARAAEPAGLVRPRVPERGALGRGHPRTRVAASAPAARAPVLVSRIHRRHRRPAARARPVRAARRVPRRRDGAGGAVGGAARPPPRRGRAPAVAVLLSESRAAGAARCLGRRRGGRRLPRSGGHRHRRAGRLGGRAGAAPGRRAADPRPPAPAHHPLRRPGRLRPPALGLRPQLRARRGLDRPRAVGGAALRLADLPAGGRRPPRQARGASSTATRRGSTPRRRAAVRRFWARGTRTREAGAIGPAWLEFAAARPHLAKHGPAWAASLAGVPDLAAGLVNAAMRGV